MRAQVEIKFECGCVARCRSCKTKYEKSCSVGLNQVRFVRFKGRMRTQFRCINQRCRKWVDIPIKRVIPVIYKKQKQEELKQV